MDDRQFLQRAIELARCSPCPDPNPQVGAVVVADGRIVGEGWHAGAGSPHAEVVALRQAGAAARGATVYVNLEPCRHQGRTPPCTDALLAAGVARVVHAEVDPGTSSSGGASVLRTAGVMVDQLSVSTGLNREWHHSIRTGRPLVTWKVASTLDGRVAARDGSSRWITSETSRADVHRLRARCGAVIVGTGTALRDDPHLGVRDASHDGRQPLRVIVGSRRLPATARLRSPDAEALQYDSPATALVGLQQRGVRHALLEGGPKLAASFWREGLVDEIVAYVAPALLGAGPSTVADLGVDTIASIQRLVLRDATVLDGDLRLTLAPAAGSTSPSPAATSTCTTTTAFTTTAFTTTKGL